MITYPYLWVSQRDVGEAEGRKARPVCLVLRLDDSKQKLHHLVLLAITSRPPSPGQRALEIPETERRRAGLMRYPRAWIVVSEYNYDIAERSYHYDANTRPLGILSARFLREVATGCGRLSWTPRRASIAPSESLGRGSHLRVAAPRNHGWEGDSDWFNWSEIILVTPAKHRNVKRARASSTGSSRGRTKRARPLQD